MSSVDGIGGAPAPETVAYPPSWVGGAARLLRYAARLTTTGTVTWLPSGASEISSAIDAGFAGSLLDATRFDTVTSDVANSGMTADGSPSASVYVAMLAAISDGVDLTPAVGSSGPEITVTGHPWFSTPDQPAGSTWVQVVVTLGATPPTITDSNGFAWTQLAQQQFGDGWLTLWSAPITRNTSATVLDERILLSETCDSGIGFGFAGQAP